MSELAQKIQSLHAKYSAGDYISAETGIQKALQLWPDDAALLQLGALTALELNQIVTAHQRLNQAEVRMPMTAELANMKGRILKASGNWAAAEEAYTLSQEIDPEFGRAKVNRLNLFLMSDQPKRVLDELNSKYDFGLMGEFARAQALTDLGRYQDALDILKSLVFDGYADQITFQKMKCYAALGQFDQMLDAFNTLPSESKLSAKALSVVVNYFEMQGERKKSLELINAVFEFNDVGPRLQAIRLLRMIGEEEDAIRHLENLSSSCPNNSDVLIEQGYATRLSGNPAVSCDLYKRALTLRPGDFGALSGFAEAAIEDGRFSDAQTVLQGALAQAPNNQFLLALVATLLREMGQSHAHLFDYENFVRVYDLTPPDGYTSIETFNAALKSRLDQLHVFSHQPVNQSLRLGTQTEMDLSLIEDPVLDAFFNAVDAPIKDYMKNLGLDKVHPLRRRNRNAYRISGAWSVRLKENGHHVNHVHPMGWLSSAYYVDVPPSVGSESREGWIKFGEPNLDLEQSAEHFIQPKPGRLVLFPSYMWHGTIPFTGSDTRLTLPFDVVPA